MEHHHEHSAADATAIEYLKFATILAGITAVAFVLYSLSESQSTYDFLRWFMGVFLIMFAGFKFAGYKMFVAMYPMYDLLAARSKAYSYSYPFIELTLGLLFVFDAIPTIRAFLVIAIMGIGAAGIIRTVYVRKQKIHCACLGNIIKLPLSTVSLAEDVGMVLMAVVMLTIQ